MWDGLFMLLILSTVMAVASFLAGALPLSFALSPRQLRFVSALGTGVLVGTALIVIIPEGIETLYSAGGKGQSHSHAERAIEVQEFPSEGVNIQAIHPSIGYSTRDRRSVEDSLKLGAIKAPSIIVRASLQGDDDSTEGHEDGKDRTHGPTPDSLENENHGREPHAWVGVSLVLGFILMYLVDVLPDALAPAEPKYRPLHISLSNLSRGPHHSTSPTIPSSPPPGPEPPVARSSATTIGLVIHAFADGIALGASTTAPSTSLSLIIFLAIMLHKAPAAFGLTSVLLKQGISKRIARTHLILFSLAAPAGAMVTWCAVHLLGRARLGGDDGLTWATGCVLLFSGGTFLYVAMHSMNESAATGHSYDHETGSNGYADGSLGVAYARPHAKNPPAVSEIVVAVIGMLVPLVTQVGHVH